MSGIRPCKSVAEQVKRANASSTGASSYLHNITNLTAAVIYLNTESKDHPHLSIPTIIALTTPTQHPTITKH